MFKRLGKGMAGLFYDAEEKAKQATTTEEAIEEKVEATTTVAPTAVAPITMVSSVGVFNQEMWNDLMQTVDENNIDGYDYLEFKQGLIALKDQPLPEAIKYQTIYAAAKSAGATVKVFTDAIRHYLGVLAGEEQGYMSMIDETTKTEVTGRQEKKAVNDEEIKSAQEQIQELTQKIQEKQTENIQLTTEENEWALKIGNQKNSFDITYKAVVDTIKSDEAKIIEHLGEKPEPKPEPEVQA